MPLPLVYHDDYSPPFPAGHRFPMEKFRLLKCTVYSGYKMSTPYALSHSLHSL